MFNDSNDLRLPVAFSGPAQLILYTRYGDPRQPGWRNKWIHKWQVQQLHPWFPVKEIEMHKHFWPLLQDAFLELEKSGLHTEIHSCQSPGKLVYVHGGPVLSVHSWGAAIDLNPEDNPTGTEGKWSQEFIKVFSKHGIFCGQNWTGIKEPMHFAMVNGD